jgi:UDP-N-acetylglucosamine--N-acetylmuramyl-(pentapeptide) pyrophosphoryl-undecaprenol N-acetylglucosamine transferase
MKNNTTKKIFLVGGGTGGHLFAAMGVAQELDNRGFKTYLITDSRCEKYLPPRLKMPIKVLHLGSLGTKWSQRMLTLCNIALKTLVMIKYIWQEKPSLVVGFGGYTSIPSLLAARFLGVNIVVHEQNAILGKVNSYFASYCVFVGVNFEKTFNVDKKILARIFPVGNPIRQEISSSCKKNFQSTPFTILVIGGSQGAQIFDTLLLKAMQYLAKITTISIKIIQQAKKENQDLLYQEYNKLGFECQISEFFHDMPALYNQAHLMICRAGASTTAELINVALPSIMIPFPNSADHHQIYNAKALFAKKAAICLIQDDLTHDILAYEILHLIENPSILKQMSENLAMMKTDAAKNFADHLISVMLQSE